MTAPHATAIIPVKSLGTAKGRLRAALDPDMRAELVGWMLEAVLDACRQAALVGEVLVVAGDERAAALARDAGVAVLVPRRPGLNHAIAAADRELTGTGATVVLAADLPLATAADVDLLCDRPGTQACLAVAPTADGGTGGLYRRPGGVVAPAFGPGSAAAHLDAATAAGVPALRVNVPGLAFDVDTPAALDELRRLGQRLPRPVPGA